LTEQQTPEVLPHRRGHRARWAALSVGVVVALLVVVLATRPDPGTRAANSPLLGKPAPELAGSTIDGQQFDVRQARGKWVLVNFFATWCVPCRQEHPDLVRFAELHRQLGDAEVVGVIYDDSESAVREYRQEEGGDWPMVVDPKGRVALDWGVAGVPESYVVTPDGRVAAKVVGGVRMASLENLLAQVRPAP
jgi:cytochrome c biogenesis protein CcmG/thiol:disulfide interchange protein DsbE